MEKKINRKRRGQKIEKLAQAILEKEKFLVWRPPKVKFQSQDILGLFDLIALSGKELKLVQVHKGRKRPYKSGKIFKLKKPKKVSFELWVWEEKNQEFKVYK